MPGKIKKHAEKVRILQLLCFPLWGSGSGTYARKLGEKLADRGDKVAIVTPDNRPIKKNKIYEVKLPFFAAFTGHSEHPGSKRYSELSAQEISQILAAFYRKTIEVVEDFAPDIIFVHHASFFTWIANYIKAIYRIPYIIIEHGTGILNSTLDSRYLPLTKDALNRSEYIICVSGDTKKWFLKVYGRQHQRKIRVIPGGVDIESFDNKISLKQIEKKYNLDRKNVVIFVGKLTKPKGVEYLVKAAAKIRGEIFIIGSGDELPRLENLTRGRKLKNVHFLGYFGPNETRQLHAFYRRADVFVIPSVWDEPLGLVVLEAMASGTPVVGSKKGGIPLVVKNNVNGFLVRARSATAIAKAVNKILRDPNLRERLGEVARQTVKEKFNWVNIAERFQKIAKNTLIIQEQKIKYLGKKLSYIDIDRQRLELRGKKLGL